MGSQSSGVTLPPAWKGLPAFNPNWPTSVFWEEELSPIRASIDTLPEEDSALLYQLVEAMNTHETKIPAAASLFFLVALCFPMVSFILVTIIYSGQYHLSMRVSFIWSIISWCEYHYVCDYYFL